MHRMRKEGEPSVSATPTDPPANLLDSGARGPDFTSAYAIAVRAEGRSAEEWLRALWEDAPRTVQVFLISGWTLLGLLPGSKGSPTHVLGWQIVSSVPERVVVERHSGLLTAHNIVDVEPRRVVFSTLVRFESRLGSLLWAAATPIHRRVTRSLLGRAARRAEAGPGSVSAAG